MVVCGVSGGGLGWWFLVVACCDGFEVIVLVLAAEMKE